MTDNGARNSSTSDDSPQRIHAAGAVLWRRKKAGRGVEIAVVHRPEYGDWSLPKGKVEKGETIPATAAREVAEETGFSSALGPRLRTISYRPRKQPQTEKTVDYFSAEAREGGFKVSREIDRLLWLSPEKAKAKLTLARDREVVEDFQALPTKLNVVVLVRHAKAGKREDWHDDDDLRPLSPAGLRQAEALRALTSVFKPVRVYAAPRTRCLETVKGVAKDATVDIHEEYSLSEEGYWVDPQRGLGRLIEIAEKPGASVICSQGGVIPDLVRHLAERSKLLLSDRFSDIKPLPSKKGSVWVLTFQPKQHGKTRMIAADYYPTALPHP